MEEYIDKLISQIRCKKARPYIEEEYRAHLEDQINANKEEGMPDEEAEKNAVLDMGDPVEVGISMDKIHRPRVAWDIIFIVGIISVLAIIVQWTFVSQISNGNYTIDGISQYTTLTGEINSAGEAINTTFGYVYSFSIGDFILNVIFGIVLMGMVYFLDYTAIAKYSKIIGSFIIVAGLYSLLFGTRVNGTFFGLGPVKISATTLMMMFVPIFGAIIFKYHGGGAISLLKCIIWLIVPTIITFRLPSLFTAGIMMICMLVQLTLAIHKGWFRVNRKISIISIWSVFLLLPIIWLFAMYETHMLAPYQEARIKTWLLCTPSEVDMISQIRLYTKSIPAFGSGGADIIGTLPDLNRDYVFTYIINTYGSIAGIVVIAVIASLIIMIFSAAFRQKNELGFSMGIGCGMLILMNAIINISCSIGILPPTSSFLPFFSAGGSNTILCYFLTGLVISIYRYKDIYPCDLGNKMIAKKQSL